MADDKATLDGDYPEQYLSCREGRHNWQRIGAYHAYGEIVVARYCTRCGGDCWDHWSTSGRRLRPRTYDMPAGYAIGSGGATMAEVRAEVLRRIPIYNSAEELSENVLKGPHGALPMTAKAKARLRSVQ